jgi:hypothetical protein
MNDEAAKLQPSGALPADEFASIKEQALARAADG